MYNHCLWFLLGRLQYPGEFGNNGYAFFGRGGGGDEVHYGLRENNEYQSHITVVSKLQECVSVLNII